MSMAYDYIYFQHENKSRIYMYVQGSNEVYEKHE